MEGLKGLRVPEWLWRDANGKGEDSAPSLGLTIDTMLIFQGTLYLNLGNL